MSMINFSGMCSRVCLCVYVIKVEPLTKYSKLRPLASIECHKRYEMSVRLFRIIVQIILNSTLGHALAFTKRVL